MHIRLKIQLLNMIHSIQKIQEKLPAVPDAASRFSILENCQRAAITIGEQIEKNVIEDNRLVPLLEEYCEIVYQVSQSGQGSEQAILLGKLRDKLEETERRLEAVPGKYRVVFLPYKADMWDSLESIWKACREDENCECDVVPIPYFEFNRSENKWEPRYDGKRFPADVTITSYEYYRLEEMQPDIAYIHNPYDDCNYVTTVHPAFYSKELKKHVRKLVYVPYYVNCGRISTVQAMLPAYVNMDYMVVQSQEAKDTCKGQFYYDKVLPLGSPKFDKVILKCQNNSHRLYGENKKTLMLNTTINDILNYEEILLKKLWYLFGLMEQRKEIGLVWRPHPLLEATIKSMRPELLTKYQELMNYFVEKNIGVLDKDGDISNTIAAVDGYIGSAASSVINLFEVCGKPIFLFDNTFCESVSEDEKRAIRFRDAVVIGEKVFAIADEWNGLFCIENKKVKFLGRVTGVTKWCTPFYSMAENGGELYFAPFRAEHAVKYDFAAGSFAQMKDCKRERDICYIRTISAGNKIFCLPINDFVMMEYDVNTSRWSYHTECMTALWKGCNRKPVEWVCWNSVYFGDSLWVTTGENNHVLQYNADKGTYAVHVIDKDSRAYSGIAADENGLWLADTRSGAIVRWFWNGRNSIYEKPAELEGWLDRFGFVRINECLIDMGQYLITVPRHSNFAVRFNKETGESCIFIKKFWEQADAAVNGFDRKFVPTGGFGKKLDERHILIQRNCDNALAVANVEDNTFEMFYPQLPEEDFGTFMDGEDGFEKPSKYDYFCRRENKLFGIKDFLEDVEKERLNTVRERQQKAVSEMAANLDGTCGEKVHKYMMEILEL